MLSCYSALSSRILTTNHLITFLTLHSRYSVLQSINTCYSLIGVVYVFRLCALFSPRISSPSLYQYYLHVFPISRNCLAPPHFPESLHRPFIPQCIYSQHCALISCEFVSSICVAYSCCILWFWNLSCSCFQLLESVSCYSAQSCKSCLLLFCCICIHCC